jgi:DNA-binding transcriptional LysR family regulator
MKGVAMHRITFQQIHYFLTIANVLNFTEASKMLFISQPALSKQIQVLEEEIGLSLLIRNKRSVSLTPEGEQIYKEWTVIEEMMVNSIYNAKLLNQTAIGHLNIGCTDTFQIDEVLSELVDNVHSKYPNIDINLESYGFKTLREKLKLKELDIIFVPNFELTNYKDVEWVSFQKVDLGIAVSVNNPLSHREVLTVNDIANEPFVVITPNESALGVEKIKALCLSNGFEPKIVKYVSNLNSLTLALKNDIGVSICHNKIVDKKIRIFDLEHQPNDSDIIGIWNVRQNSMELDLLKKELITFAKENGGYAT